MRDAHILYNGQFDAAVAHRSRDICNAHGGHTDALIYCENETELRMWPEANQIALGV